MRQFETVLKENDQANVTSQLSTLYSLMDKGVKRGVYKKNKASRSKLRISKRVAQAAS